MESLLFFKPAVLSSWTPREMREKHAILETRRLGVCMALPRHTDIPKESKSKLLLQHQAAGFTTSIRWQMCLARFYDSDLGLGTNTNLPLVTSQSERLTSFLMLFLKGETYFVKSFFPF